MNHALEVLKGEVRSRDSHAHVVVVITDSKSDDDVQAPAEALRREGVLVRNTSLRQN